MVPDTEFTGLASALMEAEHAAEQGRPLDGYEALLAGLRRAELGREMEEDWASELIRYWQLAVNGFSRRHNIDDVLPAVPPLPADARLQSHERG